MCDWKDVTAWHAGDPSGVVQRESLKDPQGPSPVAKENLARRKRCGKDIVNYVGKMSMICEMCNMCNNLPGKSMQVLDAGTAACRDCGHAGTTVIKFTAFVAHVRSKSYGILTADSVHVADADLL